MGGLSVSFHSPFVLFSSPCSVCKRPYSSVCLHHCLLAGEEQPAFHPTSLSMLCSLEQGCNPHRGTAVEIAYKPVSQLISRKGKTQRCYLAVGLLRCSIKSRKLGSKSSIWVQGCWIRYVEWERTVMSMTMFKAGTNKDFFCSCSTPTLYLYQHI